MLARFAISSGDESRGLERRNPPGELIEPGHQPGMGLPPGSVEAQVQIAEHAGQRDLPNMRQRIDRRGCRLEGGQSARDLVRLIVEPLAHMQFGRTKPRLVNLQNRGIEQAVAERLQQIGGKPRLRIGRHDLAAAGAQIEIIEDHPRVVVADTVFGDQHRNLSERILLPHAVIRIIGVGRLYVDLLVETEQRGGNPRLAAERRWWRGTQNHHDGNPPEQRKTDHGSGVAANAGGAPIRNGQTTSVVAAGPARRNHLITSPMRRDDARRF